MELVEISMLMDLVVQEMQHQNDHLIKDHVHWYRLLNEMVDDFQEYSPDHEMSFLLNKIDQ